eukprot:2145200-Rhodomonas_salina.1
MLPAFVYARSSAPSMLLLFLLFLTRTQRRRLKEVAPKVLEWDFETIIPCHGRIVGSSGS